jgi:hypothetical protein
MKSKLSDRAPLLRRLPQPGQDSLHRYLRPPRPGHDPRVLEPALHPGLPPLRAPASSLYFLKLNRPFKLALAVLFAVVLVPILGARNIFYLEVIFQIAVFAALALGLNIVVGFSGLLNFGYMAFYAVGAYLWGFFGSQQPYLLHEITGHGPARTLPFFLAPDWFYLFIFLGVIVAAIVGLVLGLPVLRVRGDYLAIITLGFGEIVRQLPTTWTSPSTSRTAPRASRRSSGRPCPRTCSPSSTGCSSRWSAIRLP